MTFLETYMVETTDTEDLGRASEAFRSPMYDDVL